MVDAAEEEHEAEAAQKVEAEAEAEEDEETEDAADEDEAVADEDEEDEAETETREPGTQSHDWAVSYKPEKSRVSTISSPTHGLSKKSRSLTN